VVIDLVRRAGSGTSFRNAAIKYVVMLMWQPEVPGIMSPSHTGGFMQIPARSFRRNIILALATSALLAAAVHAAEPAHEDAATVAASFEKQAAEFRASADRHENMARLHKAGAGSSKVTHEGIVQHCNALVKDLREAAKESDALAAEYRKESTEK
jgi:hypothetical protein